MTVTVGGLLLGTPSLGQAAAVVLASKSPAAAYRAKTPPNQLNRGTAAGKAHRVGGRTNTHVPPSFRSRYPLAGSGQGRNKASVVAPGPAAQEDGFEPGKSRELPARRTPSTTTYQNQDGTETTAFSSAPVRYRDASGAWKQVDPEFRPSTGGTLQSAGGGADITVGGGRTASVLLDDQHQVSWSLIGAAGSTPTADDDLATYRSIARDTDLEIEAQSGGAKETLVLRSARAPRTFSFQLHLTGLTPRLQDGQVLLADETGVVRATIPQGYMSDATGASSADVKYELTNGNVLRVIADDAWIDDPSRTFPVRIDPSVLTPKKIKSATAMTVNSSGAYNGSSDFEVGGAQDNRTYLKWDVSSLANETIFGANLSLVNYDANSCNPHWVDVRDVTSSWSMTPSSYSLSNAPSLGAKLDSQKFAYGHVAFGASTTACPAQASLFELGNAGRKVVQGWVNGSGNNGLAVTAPGGYWKKFAGPSTVNGPTLYVTHSPYNATYKIANPTPSPIVMQNQDGNLKVTVTNKSAMAWAAGDYSLRYRVFDSKGKVYGALPSYNSVAMPALARNATTTVTSVIKAMPAGSYSLDYSVVRNSPLTWFTDQQVAPIRLAIQVFDVPPVVTQMYPQNGYSAPTLQPQLFAKAIDVDATPGTTTYAFKVCTNSAMTAGCFSSGTAATSTGWVVPSGKLAWSKQYYWNFTSGTTTSPTLTFFTDAPQPTLTSHLAGAAYGAQEHDFDPSLGNYSTSAIDASVATVGPDLTVARTYNSLDPRTSGSFGAGWSSKFDVKAVAATNSVLVTMPDGQEVRFGKNTDGTFAAPRGKNLTFVASGSYWLMTDQTGMVYTFAQATGRLTTVKAMTGRPEVFTYDANGRLDTVTNNNSGRGLKFSWNAAGRVGSVSTLSTAINVGDTPTVVTTWTYTYDGAQLVKVCSPSNACTSYDYTAGSHYRSTVLDTKPDSYWKLGEAAGSTKAASEVAVNLGSDQATYDAGVTLGAAGAVTNSTDTAATLAGAQAIRLPNGASKKSRDMTVEVWFKAATSTTAMPLAGYQNKVFDSTTVPTTGVPLMYIGTDGKLRGQFADGTFTPITSTAVVTNSVWHQAVLTSAGSTTTLYLDGVKQNTKTSTINHVAYTYNQLGAAYATTPGSWPNYGTTSKRYFKGSLDEAAVYSHGLSATEVADQYQARSGSKQLSTVTLPSGKVAAQVDYDVEADRVASYTDQNGGTWEIGTPVVAGSATDMRRTVTVSDPADRTFIYEYDALAGYLLRSASPNGNSLRSQDVAECEPPTAQDPRFCAPPVDDPDTLETWDISGSDVRSMEYDADGRLTAVYNEVGDVVTMAYDARGNVTQRKTCRTAVGVTPADCSTTYTKYPDASSGYGPLDPRWDKPLETRDARSASATDNTYRTSYTYTASGQLASQTGPAPDNGNVVNTYSAGTEPAVEGDGSTIPSGLPLSSKDALSATTTFAYFKTGDLASITEPSGLVTRYTYDQLGRTATKAETWGGRTTTTTYTYDTQSRVTKTVMPATHDDVSGTDHQQQVIQAYDDDGNVTSTEVSDALHNDPARVTTYEFDDHNRMTAVTDPLDKQVSYSYDRFGNQISMVDAAGNRTEFAYTAKNKIAEVRLRDPDKTGSSGFLVTAAYAYDPAGRLAATFDAMGRKVVIDYLHDDLVAKKTLTTFRRPGATTDTPYVIEEYGYDKAGNVLTEKSGNGTQLITYTRDEYGRVKTATTGTAPLTRKESYTYDKVGNITRVDTTGDKSNVSWATTDSSSVSYAYDAAGRQTSEQVVLPSGTATTTTAYDAVGHVVKVVPPRGNAAGVNPDDYATTFSYDDAGNQTKIALPATLREEYGVTPALASGMQQVGYDTFGEAVSSRDASGRVSKVEYDQRGQVVKQLDPSYTPPGGSTPIVPTTTFGYDDNGNQIQVTDPNGSSTKYEYDRVGRVVKQDAPAHDDGDRAVTTYAYTRTGQVRSITGPLGTKIEHTYDDLDRELTTTTFDTVPVSDSFTTTVAYDDNSNVTSIKSPMQNATASTYDALGQLLTTTDPTGVATTFGYDGAGRQAMVKDALGRTSRTDYDVAGRVSTDVQLTAAGVEGPKQAYEYDVAGNLVKSTPSGGLPTTYEYDAADRMTKQVEPVTATTSITTTSGYDLAGNRTRYTDGRGNATWYTFSSFGLESVIEPSTVAHPALADRRWQSTYDADGRPVTLKSPGGVTRTRTYDAAGRVTKETGSGAEAATVDRELGYDQLGRTTSLSTPTGTDTYTYNQRGMPVSASGPSGSATFGYDRDGNLTTRTDASGAASFGYTNDRLSSMTDAVTGTQIGLTYNAAGDPDTVSYGSGRVRTLGYDGNGRLASDVLKNSASQTVESATYGYDNRGHVAHKTTTGVSGASDNTYGYDQAARLTSWSVAGGSTTTYDWDASGNRTKVNATTSTYDERNRLVASGGTNYSYSARGTMLSQTTGTSTESFTFDAFDRMISDGSRTYRYDGADRIADTGGSAFKYSGLQSDVISDGTSLLGRGPDGSVLSDATGSQQQLLLSDQHGDVVGGFDPANTSLTALTSSRTFDPWGKVISQTGTGSAVGYQGSWTDPSTGEINMKSRWYDASTGAFDSRDSVTYQSGPSVLANKYLYAAADPMTLNDPDGHWPHCGLCNKVTSAVSHAVSSTVSTVSHYASTAWDYTKSAASKVYGYTAAVFNAVADAGKWVYQKGKQAVSKVAHAVSTAAKWSSDRIADGIAWAKKRAAEVAAAAHRAAVVVTEKTKSAVAHAAKYNPLPAIQRAVAPVFAGVKAVVSAAANLPAQIVQKTVDVVKSTAKQVQAIYETTVKAAGNVVQAVSTAVSAAAEWTQNNWKMIASVATGIAVGALCTAATAGAGGPACALLGTVVTGAMNSALECPPGKSMASCMGSGAVDAVTAPITDAVGCVSDPTVAGCAATALDVLPAAGSKVGGKFLQGLRKTCDCFAAGTKVATAKGEKLIEKVKVGDKVWAKDLVTGKKHLRKVKAIGNHVAAAVMAVAIAGTTIHVTTEHPFHTPDRGWVQSGDLRTGDKVTLIDGGSAKVASISYASTPTRVYNFEVAADHNYAVTAAGVLVHNGAACNLGGAASTGADLPEGYSSFRAAKRSMGSPGEGHVFDHVVEQSQIKRSGFAPEEIHNPFNMNPVPAGVNQIKANYYSRKFDFTNGGTVRDWLSGQSFEAQYRFGMQALSDIRGGLIE